MAKPPDPGKAPEDGDDTKRDQVLKKMLGTPPTPKKKGGESKPAPKAKGR